MIPSLFGLTRRSLLALVGLFALIAGTVTPLPTARVTRAAVITPSRVRYTTTANGDITLVSNAIMTCPDTAPNCAAARDGAASPASQNNNNQYAMEWVDVDGDPTTFNSSSAVLALPANAEVLFAGLYWGAISTNRTTQQVQLGRPGAPYLIVPGTIIGSTSYPAQPRYAYHAFADVTALVRATGNGVYTVADMDAARAIVNVHGGWTLAIAYRDPAAPPRDLTVFDVFAEVNSASPRVNFTVTGFRAPPSGPVNARVGIVGYDGDRGSGGDQLVLNTTNIFDTANPRTNVFNSSISRLGVDVTDRNPAYINSLGFDADLFDVPAGVINNNDTTATISLTTTGPAYFPGVVTVAIDVFNPDLRTVKSVVDLNGGETRPGDVLEYSFAVTNQGDDAAVGSVLSDPIPDNTTFVPGSLQIVSGANAGPKSDSAGNDQAEYVATVPRRVVAWLGDGASGTAGGTLPIGASTVFSFRVTVDLVAADGQVLSNKADLEYFGQTSTQRLTNVSNVVSVPVVNRADLQVIKTNNLTQVTPGQNVFYEITVTNTGPDGSRGTRVRDQVPPQLQQVVWACTPGPGAACSAATGSGNRIDTTVDLPVGATATFNVRGVLSRSATGTLSNTVNATPPSGVTDPNPTTAVSTDSDPIEPLADIRVFKTINNDDPDAGDQVIFTVTVLNDGPSPATGVEVVDQLPPQLSYVSSTPSQGSYVPATGAWMVGALAAGQAATLQITATVVSTPFTNAVTVSSSSPRDPRPASNLTSVTAGQERVDLEVTKVADRSEVGVGELVTFTIEVLNNGSSVSDNVIGTDDLPAGLAFVSASEPNYDPADGSFALGQLAVGGTATLTITARVTQAGPITNTVAVQPEGQPDLVGDNNTASTELTGVAADLAITKVASALRTLPGQEYTFSITVTNNGPSDATGILVSEPPPSGARLLSNATSQGVYTPATGVWEVGGLAVGDSATLDLEVVDQQIDPYTNTASIAGADQPDPNAANNAASVTITTPPDLRLTKATGASQAAPGGVLVYTLSFVNAGTVPADEVLLTEEVPANTTFVAAQSSPGWSCPNGSPATTECRLSIGTLAPGASGTLSFAVRVADTLPPGVLGIDNRAVLGSEALEDDDPTPSDNQDDETTLFDPTAVTLVRFSAARNGNTVVLEWETATERDTRLFRIWRSSTGNRDDAVRVAEVVARGVGGRGAEYRSVDSGAKAGGVYSYYLDEEETGGRITQIASVTVSAYRLLLPLAAR